MTNFAFLVINVKKFSDDQSIWINAFTIHKSTLTISSSEQKILSMWWFDVIDIQSYNILTCTKVIPSVPAQAFNLSLTTIKYITMWIRTACSFMITIHWGCYIDLSKAKYIRKRIVPHFIEINTLSQKT